MMNTRARIKTYGTLLLLLVIGLVLIVRFHRMEHVDTSNAITVYSGRSEDLIQPLIARFTETTGIRVFIRYGQTAEMAATILEEGDNSPADVFFAQDAGALGALARTGRLTTLPVTLLERVEPRFRSAQDQWVGVSGRARVVVYNINRLSPDDLPADLSGFCDPAWNGRVGWAPANGSFQAFVTALRVMDGEKAAQDWLTCMQANGTRAYAKNTPIIAAVEAGEIDVGLVNHYYIHAIQQERQTTLHVRNHYFDSGVLVNVAGAGIVDTSKNKALAERFIRYLLSEPAQRYFTDQTFEYPLSTDIQPNPSLPPLRTLHTPSVDLGELDDLEGTLRMMQDLRIL